MDADSSVVAAAAALRPSRRKTSSAGSPEQFFREHYRDLVKATMYFGANMEQAKEAVGSALADVVSTWGSLENPKAWAAKAATHYYLKEKERGPDARRRGLAARGAGTPKGDCDSQLNVWEGEQWVAQKLALLTSYQAEVMSLVMEGLSPAEIAELLGRTPGAVRVALVAARRRLIQELEEERSSDQQLDGDRRRSRKGDR